MGNLLNAVDEIADAVDTSTRTFTLSPRESYTLYGINLTGECENTHEITYSARYPGSGWDCEDYFSRYTVTGTCSRNCFASNKPCTATFEVFNPSWVISTDCDFTLEEHGVHLGLQAGLVVTAIATSMLF